MNSALGSEIVDDAHSRSALAASPDDMADSPDELDRFPHLRPVLVDGDRPALPPTGRPSPSAGC